MGILVVILLGLAAFVDFRRRRLPNIYPSLILVVAVVGFHFQPDGALSSSWQASAMGMSASFLIFLPGWLFGQMGGGDVKLISVLGFVLGWPSIIKLILFFCVLFGLWCMVCWGFGYRERQPAVPAITISYILVNMFI